MAKDDRIWAKFAVDMPDNPKVLPLSDAAFRCLIEATLYSRRLTTDGFLASRLAVAKWGVEALQELCQNDAEKPSLIEVDGGYLIHDFGEHQETKAEIEAKRSRNRANGAKGGQARAKRVANQSAKRESSEPQAETETETETEVSSKELTTRANEAFDLAWQFWPKKTDKKKSLEQFVRVAKSRGVETVGLDVSKFGQAYGRTTETRYVPALAVWLRNERWTDELPQARGSQPAQSTKSDRAHDFINELTGGGYGREHEAVGGDRRSIGAHIEL